SCRPPSSGCSRTPRWPTCTPTTPSRAATRRASSAPEEVGRGRAPGAAAATGVAAQRPTMRPMTLLASLAATSERVGATPSRLLKVGELAALLKSLSNEELEPAAHYLSGELPQGRIGVGNATLAQAAAQPPATTATLSVAAL